VETSVIKELIADIWREMLTTGQLLTYYMVSAVIGQASKMLIFA
jgi:hypothetical protein